MSKKHIRLLGAHMSTAGGFDKAIIRGQSIGCTAIQIFTKSNRQWKAKPISAQEQELFKKAATTAKISSLLAHATYLINIGSAQEETLAKSRTLLTSELERCDQLGIPYLVLHPGSYGTGSEQECIATLVTSINLVFEGYTGNTMLLLENMAGQGSSICYSFEQLAHVRSKIKHAHKVGICIDTCHAFAAGYDLRTSKTYKAVWDEFDQTIGLSNLKALHINDSKKPLGSRVDRHADIGQGAIGLEGFRLLFNDSRFFDIPKILETPCESDNQEEVLRRYAHNMEIIKNLVE